MPIGIPIVGALIDAGLKIIDKVIPDPQAKMNAQLELMKLNQAGEFKQMEADLQLALGQIEVNKIEAGSDSLLKGGWRPTIGWICGGGLFYQFLFRPIFGWIALNLGGWAMPPSLEMETLGTLLFGMLGLGAYRSAEKIKGKA